MKLIESYNVELKEKFTKKMLKTISAYSNYHDGYIYIGVNNNGEIIGLPNIVQEKLNIENMINTTIKPTPFFEMNIIKIEQKEILEILVYKGENGPYYYDNVAYMRNDTSTIPLDGPNLTRLVLASKNTSYDQLKVSNNDLSFNYLEEKIRSILNIQKINIDILTILGLYKNNAFNNGALLLSDKSDISQSYIDIARFKLDANIFLDRRRFENRSILEYFDQVMRYFQEQYPPYQIIDGAQRITKEQVPLVAFRETLSNAIIHRDYLMNTGIQISMFDNYIEFVSPGGLPEGMDEEQYYRGLTSLPRNPIIANVFFRLNLIEQFGTGIKRIVDSYKQYRMKPYFEIRKSQIKVILPITDFDYSRLEKKEAILSYLRANPKSSRQKIEDAVKLDKNTLIRRLNEFEKKGVVSRIGNGPSTVYVCNWL